MKSDFSFLLEVGSNGALNDPPTESWPLHFAVPGLRLVGDDTRNVTITESGDDLRFLLGYPSVREWEFSWNARTRRLQVRLDRFGVANAFYYFHEGHLVISNQLDAITQAVGRLELDLEPIKFFMVAGFLEPGRTFWRRVGRVHSDAWFDLSTSAYSVSDAPWKSSFLSERVDATYRGKIRRALDEGIELIRETVRPSRFRLSGGADTRLVSILWGPDSSIEASVVQSPWMSLESDMDVNLSRAWAQRMGYRHRVVQPMESEFAFFLESAPEPYLTGLYGGELLGGQFHRVIPSNPSQWVERATAIFGPDAAEEVLTAKWANRVVHDPELWFSECARVFVQSSASTIYQSLRGSWANPYRLTNLAVSPFLTTPFLETFLSMPLSVIGDYQIYREVFADLGAGALALPLCSEATNRGIGLSPDPSWGREPKSARRGPGAPLPEAEILKSLIAKLGTHANWDGEETLRKAFLIPGAKMNILFLYSWLNRELPDPKT